MELAAVKGLLRAALEVLKEADTGTHCPQIGKWKPLLLWNHYTRWQKAKPKPDRPKTCVFGTLKAELSRRVQSIDWAA